MTAKLAIKACSTLWLNGIQTVYGRDLAKRKLFGRRLAWGGQVCMLRGLQAAPRMQPTNTDDTTSSCPRLPR